MPERSVCIPAGLQDYLQRYTQGMRRVLEAFGPVPDFSGEAASQINKVCACVLFILCSDCGFRSRKWDVKENEGPEWSGFLTG